MSNKSNHHHIIFLSLFSVLFIDGLGQGILFPILINTLVDPHSTVLVSQAFTQQHRELLYGLIIGLFFISWFLGAALLGEISDSIGRKKALMICMLGAAIAYFLTAGAFVFHSITLIIIGRLVAGLTAGSQAIAQAAIMEVSDPAKKARNVAGVLLAVSLGVVVGPVVGAVLAEPHLINWFNATTPLYFATILALINFLLLAVFFRETATIHQPRRLSLFTAIDIFISAFQHKEVRFLSVTYLLLQLGWSLFYIYCPEYLAERFQASSFQAGLFMALLGVGISIGFIFLTRTLEKYNHQKLTLIGYVLYLGAPLLTLVSYSAFPVLLMIVPAAACMAMGYSFLIMLFSAATTADRQGWVMGITQAIMALANGISSLGSGVLANHSLYLPLWVALGVSVLGCVMIPFYHQRRPI